MPNQLLTGHIAFVTGASRQGIGRAIACRLAAHGAKVVLHASGRSSPGLAETQRLIENAGGAVGSVEGDLADDAARGDLIARATEIFGAIDILVNNAAHITAYAPPSKIDLPARRGMFEINFHAPVDLIQKALPAMRQKGWGRIINITSDTVKPPEPPIQPGGAKFVHALALYGASKAALDRYTLGLAAELHGTGITVNGTKPYKIAWSDGADAVAKQAMETNPDWVEPLEMLAEAAYLLVTTGVTGLVLNSRQILQQMQSPLHALDGVTVIGDAMTIPAV